MIKNIITTAIALICMTTQAQIDRSQMPTPAAAPKVKMEKPESFTLKNGLKVLVVENHKLPRVSMNLSFDNPPFSEGDKVGVKNLTASMLGNGTKDMPKDKYHDQIDYYGARVSFGENGVYANTLSKYFPEVLKLMASGISEPLFTQEDFDAEKDKLIEGLKSQEKDVPTIAQNVGYKLSYGNHPFGEVVTQESIDKINLEDVLSNYKNTYLTNNAYLVIVGDITLSKAEKLVKQDFESWETKTVKFPVFDTPKDVAKTEIDFVDMPNAVQSEISVSNLSELKLNDKDYYAAILANHILGGGGEGRLFLNLREAHGWTYGSYSRLSGDKDIHRFRASASVRNAVTDSAVVELMNELSRIRKEPVTADELSLAKAKYIGNFVMNAEKPESVANKALKIQTQNLPDNYYENYIKNIEAVTPQQVMAAAKKYFIFDKSRIIIVGKAEEVLPGLQKLGYPIHYFDKYGNPTGNPLANVKKVEKGVTAISVINKYLDAIGGKEKATALKSSITKMSMTGAAPKPLEVTLTQLAPNKEKMLMKMGDMVIMEQSFNGEVLKVSGMMGESEKSGEEVADKVAQKGIISQAFYTSNQLELKGMAKVGDQDAYKIIVDKGGKKITEFYDTKTGLLLQSTVVEESPQGNMSINTIFSDYKEVDGLKFPFKMTQEVGPQKMVSTISEITLDKGVSAEDF